MAGNAGRRRLQLLLSAMSGGFCLVLMVAVLAVYGRPYNGAWWWIMAAILLLAVVVPRALARPVEWVIEGYREGDVAPAGSQRKRAA